MKGLMSTVVFDACTGILVHLPLFAFPQIVLASGMVMQVSDNVWVDESLIPGCSAIFCEELEAKIQTKNKQ